MLDKQDSKIIDWLTPKGVMTRGSLIWRLVAMILAVVFAMFTLGSAAQIDNPAVQNVANSLAARRGLGGIRHIEVNQLWLQEKVSDGTIEVEKVKGETNRADVLTKFKDGESLKQQLVWTGQVLTFRRHVIAPKLNSSDLLEELLGDGDEDEAQL